MSTRFNLKPETAANALTMNGTTVGLATNINSISAIGYSISWTNGSSGGFTVEVSNDYVPLPLGTSEMPLNAGTWVTLTLSTTVTSTGTAGTAYIDVVGISAAWIRLKFTNTSGSGGTWTATLAGKVQ